MSATTVPSAWQIGRVLELVREMRERQQPHEAGDDDDGLFWAGSLATETGIDPDDVLRRLIRAALEADSMDDAIERRIDDLRTRQARYVKRRAEYRASIVLVMQALNRDKFASPDASVSLRPNRGGAVVIAADAKPPPEYVRAAEPQWDKTKLKADLEAGVVVPGATLSLLSKDATR